MKILWSDFSKRMLLEIFLYYKKNASLTVANKIKKDILGATRQLEKYPNSGQIES